MLLITDSSIDMQLVETCCYGFMFRSKKLYPRLYFIQIVQSFGKMLFLAPNNYASLTFFKEKLRVSAHVSKSLARTVFTCVEKMLQCIFKLCLLHEDGI